MESSPAHIFMNKQKPGSSKRKLEGDLGEEPSSKKDKDAEESISNMAGDRAKQWKSFWIPELGPTAGNIIEYFPQPTRQALSFLMTTQRLDVLSSSWRSKYSCVKTQLAGHSSRLRLKCSTLLSLTSTTSDICPPQLVR